MAILDRSGTERYGTFDKLLVYDHDWQFYHIKTMVVQSDAHCRSHAIYTDL